MYLTDLNRPISIEAIITYIICNNKLNNENLDQLIISKTESVFSLSIEEFRSYLFRLIECILETIANKHNFKLRKKLFLMIKIFFQVMK